MRDGTSKSPSRPRSRRNLALSGSASPALGRPAVEPYTGSPTMALRRDGLAASPASPRLPRTTRLRFALRGAQRKKETNYKLGIGVQYDLTKSLGLRGEGERYRINDAVGNHGDVYVYSVGLVYMFGGNKPAPRAAAPLPEPVAVGAPAPA